MSTAATTGYCWGLLPTCDWPGESWPGAPGSLIAAAASLSLSATDPCSWLMSRNSCASSFAASIRRSLARPHWGRRGREHQACRRQQRPRVGAHQRRRGVPLFFFASLCAQISLGQDASNAGLLLLVFFGGFAIAAQWGGRILDQRGARPAVALGCAVSGVGFYLWANTLHTLSFSSQWPYLAIAGAGIGPTLGPASTDALNRAASTAYGAVTGVTQTVRNLGGSLGIAVLGSILVSRVVTNVESGLTTHGVPHAAASRIAHEVAGAGTGAIGASGSPGHAAHTLINAVQLGYAASIKTVVIGMAAAMAVAFVVGVVWMPRGRVDAEQLTPADPPTADKLVSIESH